LHKNTLKRRLGALENLYTCLRTHPTTFSKQP
jgi:hypothetical protein